MIKETYVEISGRRTGKTTRLIDAAESWKRGGGKALIINPTLRGTKLLYNNTTIEAISTFMLKNWLMENRRADLRMFFDEFDIMTDWWPVIPGEYYVTTPKFIRKKPYSPQDKLITLVALVGRSNVVNHHSPEIVDMFDPNSMPATELYGTWKEDKKKGWWQKIKEGAAWWVN